MDAEKGQDVSTTYTTYDLYLWHTDEAKNLNKYCILMQKVYQHLIIVTCISKAVILVEPISEGHLYSRERRIAL